MNIGCSSICHRIASIANSDLFPKIFFCSFFIVNNVQRIIDLWGRLIRLLIAFIGLNVLLKILRLFDNDKFLLYRMYLVVIKTF